LGAVRADAERSVAALGRGCVERIEGLRQRGLGYRVQQRLGGV
jgi:hypothetical protein